MKKIIALFLTLSSSYAAANFSCEVVVNRVLVYANGYVNVLHSGRNDYTYICNTRGTWNNVDSITCALWVSMLQNAQKNTQKSVFYYYGDGSCATLPTYGSTPAPGYIGTVQ